MGIVRMPVVATLATLLPDMVPNRLEATTDIFAAPPRCRPKIAMAKSVKNFPAPMAKRI